MATCAVCNGTLQLMGEVCPLCDGDPSFLEDNQNSSGKKAKTEKKQEEFAWEVNLGSWVRYDQATEALLEEAHAKGGGTVEYSARGQQYIVNLAAMQQANSRTGVARAIRRVEVREEVPDDAVLPPPRSQRISRLVEHLLSPAVQVQLPQEASEEPARLSPEEVKKVFIQHVPGVEGLLYRDMPGKFALHFILTAYSSGLNAFRGTDIHSHLLSLLRFTVHQFHEQKCCASRYLRDVAEAFTDCQAVQARVVERVGLELQGVRADFQGLVVRLIGSYKCMALQMLARERIKDRKAVDDGNPTHYENRLTADIGDLIGLNKDDIRRAELDEHAASRYSRLATRDGRQAATRCRALFDVDALLQAFVAEVNAFSAASLSDSLPRLFLDWVLDHMTDKHAVFDEAHGTHIDITQPLALAVLEVLFLEYVGAELEETYRGSPLQTLFRLDKRED